MKKYTFCVLTLVGLISGCASNVETYQSTQSLGQQLEDLHKAHEDGALSDSEYKKAKSLLIEHYK